MKKFFLAICAMFCFQAAASAFVTVHSIEIEGTLVSTDGKRVLEVLPFKPGDPFDPAVLEKGKKYLEEWGIFSDVRYSFRQTPKGMIVTYRLTEGKVISIINIAGNYPYVDTKVRKRISLQVGDILDTDLLEEQKTRILEFYERMGHFNTQVEIKVKPAPVKNGVTVVFHIFKGERLRYRKIRFVGVHNLVESRLHSFITELDIYSPRRLKRKLQDIMAYYRARGYLRAKARTASLTVDEENRRVDVEIEIREGPLVKIGFRGRVPYIRRTLKKTITLYEEGHFDTIECQVSAEKLTEKLVSDGWPDAQVTFEKKKLGEDLYSVNFVLKPGKRRYIADILFKGNHSISAGKLRKQMLTKRHSITQRGFLDLRKLSQDRKILEIYYRSSGFPDATVGPPEIVMNDRQTLYFVKFEIDEGTKVVVDEVRFIDNTRLNKKKILKQLVNRPEEPFSSVYLDRDREQVHFFYANNGFPYAEVKQIVERENGKTVITYETAEGPQVIVGDIFYLGDVLTSVRALRQAIAIRPGDIYNEQKIIQAELNLRKMAAFHTIEIETIGVEEKSTVVYLKVKVEERRPFVTDTEFLYSTDTRYSGTFKFTNYNAFGWAKQMRLYLQGGIEKDRAEISWIDPLFLGSDFQMTVNTWMDYEVQPIETSLQAGGGFGFFRLFKRTGFLGSYQLTRNYIFEGQTDDPRALRDSTLSETTLSVSYDTRDSFADPRKGFFVLTGAQLFNEIGGLEATFAKLKWGMVHYLPIHPKIVLSSSFRVDRIESIGATTAIPQRERLTMGGDDTVRGFQEDSLGPVNAAGNPIGGRLRLIYNAEFHIGLAGTLQLAPFYDLGSLTNSFPAVNSGSLRHSAGIGIRYITPVGPIRADYGIVLDRNPGEPFGRFHLTFGYPL